MKRIIVITAFLVCFLFTIAQVYFNDTPPVSRVASVDNVVVGNTQWSVLWNEAQATTL